MKTMRTGSDTDQKHAAERSYNLFATYVAGVDKPGDVPEGGQLAVHVAADLAVLPAVVDVDERHHVPLRGARRETF